MASFQPPPFDPHPVIRGGHLQTIVTLGQRVVHDLNPRQHVVPVSDGDSIVLHRDCPETWQPSDGAMLLVHGLSGCHDAPYMLRLAQQFVGRGLCVYRMDMRGCGAAFALSKNVTHAGRSDDVIKALEAVACWTQTSPLSAIGVSLGASQLLRAVGRIGAGIDPKPAWFQRLTRIAAVAPPLDLHRCSKNMERWVLRPYNYYFIRALLARTPAQVRRRDEFQSQIEGPRPKTIRELDDRFTAPLSGFADASDYYTRTSAGAVTRDNPIPTLVLAASNDPIVPIGCFLDDPSMWPDSTHVVVSRTGGHVGFIDRRKQSWMDHVLAAWFIRPL